MKEGAINKEALNRIDGRLKVTGTARYPAEFTLVGMVINGSQDHTLDFSV